MPEKAGIHALRSLCLAILFCVAVPVLAEAQSNAVTGGGSARLTESALRAELGNLHEITLHSGINDVYFDGVAQAARIIMAGQEGVDGSSHSVFFITAQTGDDAAWMVVPTGDNEDATIEDEYDVGYIFRDVRFMNGTLNGNPATFLFVATLSGAPSGSPAPNAAILVEIAQGIDCCAPFEFAPILRFKTKAVYTDAAGALLHELNIPLPAGYKPES
jgi:hypothetical protein